MLQQTHEWNEKTHKTAVKLWSEGVSITEVAAHFSISRSAVSGYVSRNRSDFPTRRKDVRNDGKPVPRKPPTAWTEERLSAAAALWKAGWKQEEVAEQFGVSKAAFANVMMRNRARFPAARDIVHRHPPKPRKPRREVPDNLDALFEQSGGKAFADGRRFILAGQEPVAFASLKPAQCVFPVSSPDTPSDGSMPCCGAQKAQGLPYCLAHAAISYRVRA